MTASPIRVVLAGSPLFRAAIRQALTGFPDLRVAGEAPDAVEVLLLTGATGADVVVVELADLGRGEDDMPGVATHLLAEYPRLKVLAISADTGLALLGELSPRVVRLARPGVDRVADLIRMAVTRC